MNTSLLPEGDAPSLRPEFARMFRQVGLQFVRASLVDIATLGFQPAWSIADNGEVSDGPGDTGSDSAFPGAAAMVGGLVGAAHEHTRVQRQSPRRWAFTWRVGQDQAIVAEAHFREKRDAITDIDTALVRLACSASVHLSPSSGVALAQLDEAEAWPRVDRRARPRPWPLVWLAIGLPAAAALLCAWLALVALPQAAETSLQQQARIAQLNKAADETIVTDLSIALGTGDYGQLQDELTRFARIGYFQSAVVTNDKGRVVAMAGPTEAVRIGDALPTAYRAVATAHPLMLGQQRQGELSEVPLVAATSVPTLAGARIMVVLAALAGAATALLLYLRRRRLLGD